MGSYIIRNQIQHTVVNRDENNSLKIDNSHLSKELSSVPEQDHFLMPDSLKTNKSFIPNIFSKTNAISPRPKPQGSTKFNFKPDFFQQRHAAPTQHQKAPNSLDRSRLNLSGKRMS